MALLCSKKDKKRWLQKKKLGRLESGSQKDGLTTKGYACGHCGEAFAKLNELIVGPNKLLDLIVLVRKRHDVLRIKSLCKHLETLQKVQ